MAYIGRSVNYGNAVTQQLTGNNGASYVLLYDTTTDSVVISLDGVVQVNGTDFNITGTALVFTSTVATGIQINVIYTGLTIAVGVPADNTITILLFLFSIICLIKLNPFLVIEVPPNL